MKERKFKPVLIINLLTFYELKFLKIESKVKSTNIIFDNEYKRTN